MARRRKPRDGFTEQAVRQHLTAHHPKCPPPVIEEIVGRLDGRKWDPHVTLGRAVGIVTTTFVRHCLTDYERLLKVDRLKRDEARAMVAPVVVAIIDSWQ